MSYVYISKFPLNLPSLIAHTPIVHVAAVGFPYFNQTCEGLDTWLSYNCHFYILIRTDIWPEREHDTIRRLAKNTDCVKQQNTDKTKNASKIACKHRAYMYIFLQFYHVPGMNHKLYAPRT